MHGGFGRPYNTARVNDEIVHATFRYNACHFISSGTYLKGWLTKIAVLVPELFGLLDEEDEDE